MANQRFKTTIQSGDRGRVFINLPARLDSVRAPENYLGLDERPDIREREGHECASKYFQTGK